MALSAVEFGSGRITRADVALGPVERGSEILSAVLEGLEALRAIDKEADVSETITLLLVELGGFDCVVLWRVEGSLLRRVAATFANDAEPSASELRRLAGNPPRLEECGMDVAVLRAEDLAVTGSLGAGGQTRHVMAPLSYVVAAVKSGSNATFVLQAICRERRVEQADRDLLQSFALLVASLIIEPGATELFKRCRGRGRTGRQDPVHYSGPRLAEAPAMAANRPIVDASTQALMTLTVREHEVLAHALTGATYAAIADALFVSVTTIRSHMQSILRKLGLHSRAQLIARFATAGSGGRLPP